MDESNCQFNSGDQQVFCRRGVKHVVRVNESTKSGCTLTVTCSATGKLLPMMVVTRSLKNNPCEVRQVGTRKFVFATSNSGWMNGPLMSMWLGIFLSLETWYTVLCQNVLIFMIHFYIIFENIFSFGFIVISLISKFLLSFFLPRLLLHVINDIHLKSPLGFFSKVFGVHPPLGSWAWKDKQG